MEALRRASPVPMEIKPVARDTDGFFSIKAQSITIRAGMSEVQTVCAAVHEIAHAKLHDYEHMTELADDGETILGPAKRAATPRRSRPKASPMRSASITALKRAKTASAISPHGQRARS